MKMLFAVAFLLTSTFSMANSINAAISNDAVVKAVIKSVEAKYSVKCRDLDVKAVKKGVIEASTVCFDVVPGEDDEEGAVIIDIDAESYGEGPDAMLVITNIGFILAG